GAWRVRVRSGQILIDSHGLLRVDVEAFHEPARIVCPNRNHDEVEWSASSSNVAELWVVAGVAREVRPLPIQLERKSAPERPVSIAQPPMLKCRAGVPVACRAEIPVSCHQSSSMTPRTPQARMYAPSPRGAESTPPPSSMVASRPNWDTLR